MHTNAVLLWVLLVVLYNFVILIIISVEIVCAYFDHGECLYYWQTTDDENLAIYTNTEFHATPLNGFRRVGYQVLKE